MAANAGRRNAIAALRQALNIVRHSNTAGSTTFIDIILYV